MTSSDINKPARPGLSLYANLLDTSSNKDTEFAPSTISRAPVVFKQVAGSEAQQNRTAEKQQISTASLRFQPTKRPQLSNQKPKSRIPSSRVPVPAPLSNNPGPISLENAAATARLPAKMSIAEWTAEGEGIDCGGFYEGEKRQRGGRKKRKKTKDEPQAIQNWDSLYDPSRPNNFEDYKYSEEKMLEARDWKDKLYAHRVARQPDSDSDSSNDLYKSPLNRPFAPQRLNFAPPTDFEKISQSQQTLFSDNDLDNPVGKGAYEQRLRSSQFAHQPDTVNGSEDSSQRTPLSSGPSLPASNESVFIRSIQSPTSNAAAFPSISRAPVRYNLPAAPADIPASEAELEEALRTDQMEEELQPDAATRSLRPGQKGFAERLMSKYGWSKGSGLGVSGSGIIKPLRVQIEKQKKKSDSEGGGFVGPGGRGKIVGGMKKGAPSGETRVGKYGAMSEVIILRGIVDGMNLDAELEGVHDGGLLQEIGDECGEKYGRVERVFVDRRSDLKSPVFVKFTSQLSAIRAVNALEGRMFNGNTIVARFYDNEKFEAGVYD